MAMGKVPTDVNGLAITADITKANGKWAPYLQLINTQQQQQKEKQQQRQQQQEQFINTYTLAANLNES